jgi:hypothetical protein
VCQKSHGASHQVNNVVLLIDVLILIFIYFWEYYLLDEVQDKAVEKKE